jgi:phosphoribosyl-AMP cyclohydrolase
MGSVPVSERWESALGGRGAGAVGAETRVGLWDGPASRIGLMRASGRCPLLGAAVPAEAEAGGPVLPVAWVRRSGGPAFRCPAPAAAWVRRFGGQWSGGPGPVRRRFGGSVFRRSVSAGRWAGGPVGRRPGVREPVARWPRRAGQNGRMTGSDRPSVLDPALAARLKRDANGLLPAIAQQYDTGEVLMLGWMDDEALHRTLTTGRCTYWSRSRREYWVKGDTSGHVQHVKSVALDCDADTVLVKVDQVGGACHTGDRTCFDATPLDAVVGVRPA